MTGEKLSGTPASMNVLFVSGCRKFLFHFIPQSELNVFLAESHVLDDVESL